MELYEKILLENKRLRSAYKSKKLEVNREEQECKQNLEKAKRIKEELLQEKESSNLLGFSFMMNRPHRDLKASVCVCLLIFLDLQERRPKK